MEYESLLKENTEKLESAKEKRRIEFKNKEIERQEKLKKDEEMIIQIDNLLNLYNFNSIIQQFDGLLKMMPLYRCE